MMTDVLIAERVHLTQAASRDLKGQERWDQVEWKCYTWEPAEEYRNRRPNLTRVTTFARRLMAMERSRALRRNPTDYRAYLKKKRLVPGGRSR